MLLATSLPGTIALAHTCHVDPGMAMTPLVGSAPGAQIRATITANLDGRRQRGYFVYLVVLTAALAWDLLRVLRSGR